MSFDLLKPVPDMTYNVFVGTLSLTQPLTVRWCNRWCRRETEWHM